MAKKDKKSKDKKAKGTNKKLFFLTIISLTCVFFMQLTFLFAVLGLMPSFVAYFIDRSTSKSSYHAVLACNLSGVLVVIAPLLAHGNQVSELHVFMASPTNWLVMYASAAFGWILIYGCPYVGQFMIDAIQTKTLTRLSGNNKALEEEWGEDLRYSEHS